MSADAGPSGTDAGTGPIDDGGCSCRAGAGSRGSSGTAAVALALLSLLVVRKRS
jgi:MYXO-CTERM domain-containing protein